MPIWLEPWWLKIVPAFWAVAGLGFLIFIHELGHFLAAKRAGVKVEVFSLGVGHFITSFSRRGTIYALSWLPLGGYVRMAGQQDLVAPADRQPLPWEYGAKRPTVRMIIIAAGVIMNFIGGYLCFSAAFLVGREVEAPVVGKLDPDRTRQKAALDAGLLTGDRVLAVNGSPVYTFDSLHMRILRLPPRTEATLRVRHPDGSEADVRLTTYEGNRRGLSLTVPSDPDLRPMGPGTLRLGFSGRNELVVAPRYKTLDGFPEWKALFRPGDIIETAGGRSCSSPEDFSRAAELGDGKTLEVEVRSTDGQKRRLEVRLRSSFIIGIGPEDEEKPPLRVAAVQEESSAERAGIEIGDRLYLSADLRPCSFKEFKTAVQRSAGEPLKIWAEGAAGVRDVELRASRVWTPALDESRPVIPWASLLVVDEVAPRSDAAAKGLRPGDMIVMVSTQREPDAAEAKARGMRPEDLIPPATVEWLSDGRKRGPYRLSPFPDGPAVVWKRVPDLKLVRLPLSEALAAGWTETIEAVRATGAVFSRVGKGEIAPTDAVSGPGRIAQMAYILARSGPGHLLWLLGIMGISLALINFLPIPVLDGGHMMFLIWEAVTRRPPSLRILEVGQVIGLLIIAGLFVMAFWSDISNWLR